MFGQKIDFLQFLKNAVFYKKIDDFKKFLVKFLSKDAYFYILYLKGFRKLRQKLFLTKPKKSISQENNICQQPLNYSSYLKLHACVTCIIVIIYRPPKITLCYSKVGNSRNLIVRAKFVYFFLKTARLK